MKVLNLDKLVKDEQREIVLFGKTYVVEGMTVDNFIKSNLDAEALAGESLVKQLEATIEMIKRSIPGVSDSDLRKLELEQLTAIVAFIRGEDVAGADKATVASEGEDGEKK